MSLPRVLVVDDQYARDPTERIVFLRHSGLMEEGVLSETEAPGQPIGTAIFCSGQRVTDGRTVNDYNIVRAAVAGEAQVQPWSLVLLDARFESGPFDDSGVPTGTLGDNSFGEEVRERLVADFPGLPVVMLSSKGQQELQDRATPYLSKQGLDSRALVIALLRFGSLTPEQVRRLLALPEDVVAVSQPMLDVFRRAFECAVSNVSVLLLGESGVGKEVVAHYIHRQSHRSSGPFIAVNVAAVPRELLEAELFGYEKGAFTGAVSAREGRFQQAAGGTLFLDEIGDMPLEAQAKVLRAIQEREIYRVGGGRAEPVDIRLVSATSRDLPARIAVGQFREDLFYRINTVPLEIPPLRERPEDLPALGKALLAKFVAREGKAGIELSPEAMERLETHSFPGNVRELENLLQRLLTGTGNNRVISEQEVIAVLQRARSALGEAAPSAGATAAIHHLDAVPPRLKLADLAALLDSLEIDPGDPALIGAKARIEEDVSRLMRRLAGAALERCRDPVSGGLNRQRALQLLTGDPDLKGKGPARVVNQLLGRRQETSVTDDELELLVQCWRDGKDFDR